MHSTAWAKFFAVLVAAILVVAGASAAGVAAQSGPGVDPAARKPTATPTRTPTFVAPTVTPTTGASGHALMLSLASNRSNPAPLAGQTVTGNIYVFVSPESGASQVRFYLDNPPASGTPTWTESNPPWDFAGGTVSAANPYNTANLANGAHSITASITLTSGATTVITANFTVSNGGSTATPTRTAPAPTATPTRTPTFVAPTATPTTGASGHALMLSLASNRSNPAPLAGQTVTGNIYVFVSPESGASQVRFYLDNPPASGTPTWTESNPPWDFAGGAVSAANPYNTANLANGAHSITASITLTSGATTVITANFTVSNGGSGTSCAGPFDQVHLAWVGEPSSTLNIVWRTCNTATASTVQYRPLGSGPWLAVIGSLRSSGTAGTLHEVALAGLAAGTVYEYMVQGDGGAWSQPFIARTAPPPGPATFDAIYYADTGLVGRTDGLATGTQQVVDEIARINPLLVLTGGDYAYFDTDKRLRHARQLHRRLVQPEPADRVAVRDDAHLRQPRGRARRERLCLDRALSLAERVRQSPQLLIRRGRRPLHLARRVDGQPGTDHGTEAVAGE